MKVLTVMRDGARNKLAKMRESVKPLEKAKKSLEADYKALVTENRNAAHEIKSLKVRLNSDHQAMAGKDATNDAGTKADLEPSDKKARKLSTAEAREAGEARDKADRAAGKLRGELEVLRAKMKRTAEELRASRTAETNLKERLEFYLGQCAKFETKDAERRDKLTTAQEAAREATARAGGLEGRLALHRHSEETLLQQIEALKSAPRTLAARLRRKDWEIETYQRKLDSIFEANAGGLAAGKAELGAGSALDLSVAPGPEGVKVEPDSSGRDRGCLAVAGTKRKYSDHSGSSVEEEAATSPFGREHLFGFSPAS
jgi:chromosome segregation ATPase